MAWIGNVDQYEHICVPKNVNEVAGTNVRQSIQAELASGTQETGTQARVRIDRKIVQGFGGLPDPDFDIIRHAAVGNKVATDGALYRAKRKNCQRITTFKEFMTEEKLEELLVYFEGLAQEISEEEAQLNVVFDAE
uniref:Uncharacterized protein n=1 Tax=Ditylenchus dipsaci TaxID=166011 RepID=A0A915EQ52_9BILA